MSEEEVLIRLMDYLTANDKSGVLDPNGHYAFSVVAFVRPDKPEDWVDCKTPADKKATVASAAFTLGTGSTEHPPVEQVCANVLHHFNEARLEDLIVETQSAIRRREETLQ